MYTANLLKIWRVYNYADLILDYGTDLTQRRTPSRVLGYHSRATRTRSSICVIGLELAVVLALERKIVRAVLKIKKMILMALSYVMMMYVLERSH